LLKVVAFLLLAAMKATLDIKAFLPRLYQISIFLPLHAEVPEVLKAGSRNSSLGIIVSETDIPDSQANPVDQIYNRGYLASSFPVS
jgi:hypothetical protein